MNPPQQHIAQCRQIVAGWIPHRPTHDHPEGITQVRADICARFKRLGFAVQQIDNPDAPHRPLLIARRQGSGDRGSGSQVQGSRESGSQVQGSHRPDSRGSGSQVPGSHRPDSRGSGSREPGSGAPTIGFFSHYDVEPVPDARQWHTDPWQLTERDGRWYGRGIGDNLLPLAQRLLLLEEHFRHVSVLCILQGEEEMLGPFAHRIYPSLKPGRVDLWLEETGYFGADGNQRILTLNSNDSLERLVGRLSDIAAADSRTVRRQSRTLNKAFGGKQCPCHAHLLGDIPYLAIGPNDDDCAIHAPNESMDPSLLPVSARQLAAVSDWAGAAL